MSNGVNKWGELSPLRKLLVAVLVSIVLAQLAAMTLLVRSQVLKAEMRAAVESSTRATASLSAASAARPGGNLTVGYAASR